MTGTDSIRTAEYSALMDQIRDLDRTAQWSWAAAAVAATVLFSSAIDARNPGLMLPVEFCIAFGFYASVRGRRHTRLIESYVQATHESATDGAQWYTRRAQMLARPGMPAGAEWLPLAVANVTTLTAVVFGWVFAGNVPHGELMAGLVTTTGIAFSVHSLVETMRLEAAQAVTMAAAPNAGLQEVKPESRAASWR